MKNIKWLCLLLVFTNCNAQEKLLLNKTVISDWAEYPVYEQLVETKDGKNVWKAEYEYLDDIEVSGITYLSDGLKVKGMLVKPKKAGNYPCLIYNRGGNREFGSFNVTYAVAKLGPIAKEGYVVIASQYRGNGGGEGQEEFGGKDVNDVVILTDVLEEIADTDTSRIGMYGWSRGGMMTYIALTKTDRIKAAIVGGAVSDSHSGIEERPQMESMVYSELIPNYEQNKEEELTKRSAVKWADKFPKNVPILMLHGNSDWRVKSEQSLRLALEFDKYRVPYRLKIFEGGDHGISEFRDEVREEVINWLDRFVKGNEPLPNMEFHGR